MQYWEVEVRSIRSAHKHSVGLFGCFWIFFYYFFCIYYDGIGIPASNIISASMLDLHVFRQDTAMHVRLHADA